jgi:hypothetical protein
MQQPLPSNELCFEFCLSFSCFRFHRVFRDLISSLHEPLTIQRVWAMTSRPTATSPATGFADITDGLQVARIGPKGGLKMTLTRVLLLGMVALFAVPASQVQAWYRVGVYVGPGYYRPYYPVGVYVAPAPVVVAPAPVVVAPQPVYVVQPAPQPVYIQSAPVAAQPAPAPAPGGYQTLPAQPVPVR